MKFHYKKIFFYKWVMVCVLLSIYSCTSTNIGLNQSQIIPNQKLINLISFTKLLGYVQYFHPSDEAQNTNWELFAEQGISLIENASDCDALLSKLKGYFLPIAPTISFYKSSEEIILEKPKNITEDLELVSWHHQGFGYGVSQEIYSSKLFFSKIPTNNLYNSDLQNNYVSNLGCEINVVVPTVLFKDETGTLPHQEIPSEEILILPSDASRIRHIATVALSWNVLRIFYPYFDVISTNWDDALTIALIGAEQAENEEQFIIVLEKMMAKLQDGHGKIYTEFPPSTNIYRPAFGWDWVENQLVVTFVEKELTEQINVGDEVIEINEQTISEAMKYQRELISGATSQWVTFQSIQNLLTGELNSTIKLKLKSKSGNVYQRIYNRTVYIGLNPFIFTEERPKVIIEIKPNIWYVDLTRITNDEYIDYLPKLKNASGIVFDMRGYPFLINPNTILGHLIDQEVNWPLLQIPIITYPSHNTINYKNITQTIPPASPQLTDNVVFIVDGRVISYGESIMQTIKSNNIAKIVGLPTAGTNGNVVVFTLFEKYTFQFSGMRVLNQDGSQHHGIGVYPTTIISRTLEGIRTQEDELLLGALNELIR